MAEVLTAHQRQNAGSCLCGWAELGKSHPEHQAAMLSAAEFEEAADARPADPLTAAAEAIRTAGIHESPSRLAKAALAAAGFAEAQRQLRAVESLVLTAARDAALFGRGGPGCVSVTNLRAALASNEERRNHGTR